MYRFKVIQTITESPTRRIIQLKNWRCFSTAEPMSSEQTAGPDPSLLQTKLSNLCGPSEQIKKGQVQWGVTFTNHMFEAEWHLEEGWSAPRVVPRHTIELDPAASVLHYGLEVFEGLKAHRGTKDGKIRLFRPDRNIKRMAISCARLGLASFDEKMMLECLRRYVSIEKDWVPHGKGTALYLRPTCIAVDPKLGVARSKRNLFYIIASPVGSYFQGSAPGVNLLVTTKYFRSFPGGIGFCKTGANYALGIIPTEKAARLGCQQVLWLSDPNNRYVTEAGVMNFFVLFRGKSRPELVTAPLDGTILDGVVRRSILELVRSWGNVDVSERKYSIDEVVQKISDGEVIEAFGCGTASIITPVNGIHYSGQLHPITSESKDKISPKLLKELQDIFYEKGILTSKFAKVKYCRDNNRVDTFKLNHQLVEHLDRNMAISMAAFIKHPSSWQRFGLSLFPSFQEKTKLGSFEWFIFIICCFLLLGLFGILASTPSKKPIQRPSVSNKIRRPPKLFTLEELRQYNGENGRPIYIAVQGPFDQAPVVFDVSRGRDFYGPGAPYHIFAGKNASRGLAKTSTDPDDVEGPLDDLSVSEQDALSQWYLRFMEKYENIGHLSVESNEKQKEEKAA
eukprot:jgi/Galph1/4864/GphlegSOOS_G3573.1